MQTQFENDDFEIEEYNINDMKKSLAIAESLAKACLMTSPAAKRRLAARSLELGYLDKTGGYVPPKQLLIYLVRMGSFTSAPKILNEDSQDNELDLPERLSQQELLQFCQKQTAHHPPMVKRSFRKPDGKPEILNFRKLNAFSKGCSDFISSPHSLRIFQWNVLSQALGLNNDNFVCCPDEALDWSARKYHMVEEIVEYCPDIICLQEVDHFNFLSKTLSSQGYVGSFFPKPDSPCLYIQDNNGPDGCAIFYRQNKFELIGLQSRILEVWRVQSNQVAILALLRVRETGQELCVATTHLKARSGALLSTLRNEQGKDLLDFVAGNSGGRPVIICGDFNAEPTEPVYMTVLSRPDLGLSSAYADAQPAGDLAKLVSVDREPAYTTWKIREEGEVCHTIDYVFYSKDSLAVESVLDFPTGEEIGQGRVPSLAYPSDHFSLVCDFQIAPSPSSVGRL